MWNAGGGVTVDKFKAFKAVLGKFCKALVLDSFVQAGIKTHHYVAKRCKPRDGSHKQAKLWMTCLGLFLNKKNDVYKMLL